MHTFLKRSFLLFVSCFMLSHVSAYAEGTQVAGQPYNATYQYLIGFMAILLLVIAVLGITLRQLAIAVSEKIQKEKKNGSNLTAVLVFMIICLLPASSFAADSPEMFKLPAVIDGIPSGDFIALLLIIALEFVVIFSLVAYINSLVKVLRGEKDAAVEKAAVAKVSFWDKFNNVAPIEKEKEILLDHNYDGIQELDNSLPPWWKYGFYLTIVVGFIYMYRFHVSHDGLSQEEELAVEIQKGEEAKAAYLAKSANNVDETTVKYLNDESTIAAGKELFIKNCAACHVADGGGSVGPNLTDEYWLHGGGIKDIFKSIKYGWQDKGMKSWKDDLSPVQMQQAACFIMSLKGSHPAAPKAPQGDVYVEIANSKSEASAKDSLAVSK